MKHILEISAVLAEVKRNLVQRCSSPETLFQLCAMCSALLSCTSLPPSLCEPTSMQEQLNKNHMHTRGCILWQSTCFACRSPTSSCCHSTEASVIQLRITQFNKYVQDLENRSLRMNFTELKVKAATGSSLRKRIKEGAHAFSFAF